MSLRLLVQIVRDGEPQETWIDAPETLSVQQLIETLKLSQLRTQMVVLFEREIVPDDLLLRDLFKGLDETERVLVILIVAPPIREILESALHRVDLDADDFDLSDDDDGSGIQLSVDDADEGEVLSASESGVLTPPPIQSMPGSPAPAAPSAPPAPRSAGRRRAPMTATMDRDEMESEAYSARAAKREIVQRRATVRYYDRMNPQKVFPFMVTLTSAKVKEILQHRVAQNESRPFEARLDEFIQIEPILPGCTCYPSKAELKLTAADTAVHFWVVPQVLGKVKGAKVVITQEGQTLGEVELDVRVRKTTIALVLGILTLLYPLIAASLKQIGLDFNDLGQLGQYLTLIGGYLKAVSPLAIFIGLGLLSGALYWWSRPRQRDQFWDLDTERK